MRHARVLLGGTQFVGRHIAEAAIAAGHEVVFAHRGRTNLSLFTEHRHIAIDRYGDRSALGGVEADVAIDTRGFAPDSVAQSARLLEPSVSRYVFVSSINAYDLGVPHIDERSPTLTLPAGAQT